MKEETSENKNSKIKEEASKKEGRMVISLEAEAAVSEFADAVNSDFEAGRATRYDAASFMLIWFKENAPTDVLFELRRRLANGFSMLDALQKKYKAHGELPPELKAVLEQHFFGGPLNCKKPKKNLKQEYITDIHNESEAA